jgi:hypothetical protein
LEDELIEIRRSVSKREDQALFPELVRFARRAENDAAHRHDEPVIDKALMLSRTRWELLEEYEVRSHPEPLGVPSVCANCHASTLAPSGRTTRARTSSA